jgi:hypothetical protein
MKHLKRFIAFIKSMFGFEKTYSIEEIESLDEVKVVPNILYIERRGERDRWLHLSCPCGCGELLSVNLMTSVSPHWLISRNRDQTLTVSPSLYRMDGCRSHFFVRSSRIQWAY